MNKLNEFLRLCRNNEKYVKLAVIALVVITALVFFGTKGEKEEISLIQDGESTVQIEATAETGLSEDELAQDEAATQIETENTIKLVVDIDGAVKNPGIYEVDEGTRLYEVIEMAGGLSEDADTTLINQAEVLYDGEKVLLPTVVESSGDSDGSGTGASAGITADGRININVADSTILQEIPGVGPATAEKIIAYRDANGRFKSIEEIKNVSGIGEKTFEKIKDLITV